MNILIFHFWSHLIRTNFILYIDQTRPLFVYFFQFQTKFLLNSILGIEWAKKFDQTRAQ